MREASGVVSAGLAAPQPGILCCMFCFDFVSLISLGLVSWLFVCLYSNKSHRCGGLKSVFLWLIWASGGVLIAP